MPRKFANPLPERWTSALKLVAAGRGDEADAEALEGLRDTGYAKVHGAGWVLTGAGRRRMENELASTAEGL